MTCKSSSEHRWDTINIVKDTGPTGALDSACTLTVGSEKDREEFTEERGETDKIFILPKGEEAPATERRELNWDLLPPVNEVNIVPGVHITLISLCKMADAGYVTLLDKEGAKIMTAKRH